MGLPWKGSITRHRIGLEGQQTSQNATSSKTQRTNEETLQQK